MIKTKEQIEFLFANKTKAGLELEYAGVGLLDIASDRKLEKLSVLFSAMANAKGGTVLFGIKPYRNFPKEYEPFDSSVFTPDWFRYILQNYMHPAMNEAEVCSIALNEKDNAIAVNIPDSSNAPFMASDKRYYRRVENKSVTMEEYEVRDMYQRTKHVELDMFAIINTGGVPVLESGRFAKMTFYPRFLIKNISSVIEKNYKLELYLPSALQNANFDPLQQYFSRMEDEFTVFSVTGKHPLFQNETATILEAQFIVDRDSFKQFENGEIIVKLYYSDGMKTKSFKLKHTFLYQNKELLYTDFATDTNTLDLKFN